VPDIRLWRTVIRRHTVGLLLSEWPHPNCGCTAQFGVDVDNAVAQEGVVPPDAV
jgi:hypothetical protein